MQATTSTARSEFTLLRVHRLQLASIPEPGEPVAAASALSGPRSSSGARTAVVPGSIVFTGHSMLAMNQRPPCKVLPT